MEKSIDLMTYWGDGRQDFFPHCILNEFKTVFQTACQQSRFCGGFVSRRAIIWSFWLDSNSGDSNSG